MNADEPIKAFLDGRRTFDVLIRDLRDLSLSVVDGAGIVDESLKHYVQAGRLPLDLALLIRGALGNMPVMAHDELLDAPTIPALDRRTTRLDTAMPLPNTQPATARGAPEAEPYRKQVDEVVLAALTEDFVGLRRSGPQPNSARPRVDRHLDHALSDFKGARLRRDATRAAQGQARPFDVTRDSSGRAAKPIGIGSVLKSRFVLDREIGRGGMGIVYRAVDRRRLEAAHDDPYVALKVLNAELLRNPDSLRILEAEARRAQSLSHPNIVTVYDFDRDGQSVFIVMQLLAGQPLDQIINEAGDKGLGYEKGRPIIDAICEGLGHAHQRGVIHCDLKPANVFVEQGGGVKLLDFGISTATRSSGFDLASLNAYTVAYSSPEVLRGEPRHTRDDVYALGCLAYMLITGRHPFDRLSALDAQARRLVPEAPRDVPRAAWLALKRALAFEPAKRTPDARSFGIEFSGRAGGFFSRLFRR